MLGFTPKPLRLVLAFVYFLVAGCALLSPTPLPPGKSLIRGYSTFCRGTIQVKTAADQNFVTELIISPGGQTLSVRFDSEPEPSDEYPGDPSYLCVWRSTYDVTFSPLPDKRYHVVADWQGNDMYNMNVYQSISDTGPESTQVPSTSALITRKKFCGFFVECVN